MVLHAARSGEFDETTFPQCANDHDVGTAALTAALEGLAPATFPVDPAYRLICTAIYSEVGDDIETYLGFPSIARMIMAAYLGTLEREQHVKTLLSSLLPLRWVGGNVPHYAVASHLLTEGECLRTTIWAWKQEAEQRGAPDRAEVCGEIRIACK